MSTTSADGLRSAGLTTSGLTTAGLTTAGLTTAGLTSAGATSAEAALRRQESLRTRAYLWLVLAIAASMAVLIPISNLSTTGKWILAAYTAILTPATLLVGRPLTNDATDSPGRALAYGLLCVAMTFGTIYICGPYSTAMGFMVLTIYVSTGRELWVAVAVCGAGIAGHLVFHALVTTGTIHDPSLASILDLDSVTRHIGVAPLIVVYVGMLVTGRVGRRTTMEAIEQHSQAVRSLTQRMALLSEARKDLERMLHASGLGRYTDEVLGSYRLGSVLGRGGMGEVYEAVHIESKQRAAVKLLHPHVAMGKTQLRRFLREARIAASLQSNHVCRVYEIADIEADHPYIAMERLIGNNLGDILRERSQLSVAEVVELVTQIASGLEAARKAGIVHRDIKPDNLFYAQTYEGKTWKILDFGVSKLADSSGTLTQKNMVGTPRYMSPEQVTGGDVNHQADLFSLAVVAYRAITGRPAFAADSRSELLFRIVHKMPPRPLDTQPMPNEVELVLAVALAKKPQERFTTAVEFANALAEARHGRIDEDTANRAAKNLARNPWR